MCKYCSFENYAHIHEYMMFPYCIPKILFIYQESSWKYLETKRNTYYACTHINTRLHIDTRTHAHIHTHHAADGRWKTNTSPKNQATNKHNLIANLPYLSPLSALPPNTFRRPINERRTHSRRRYTAPSTPKIRPQHKTTWSLPCYCYPLRAPSRQLT